MIKPLGETALVEQIKLTLTTTKYFIGLNWEASLHIIVFLF